jgi:ribosome biogenesis protein ENP2
LNDFCIDPNNGVSFLAVEDVRVQAYFIPAIGPAPKWCISLESITEELEEKTEKNIYTDYKFITRKDLKESGLEILIGSGLLKTYMHGFFIHHRLFKQINQINSKHIYENYMKLKIKKKN